MANASGSPPFFRTAPMSSYCHNAESRRMPFDERLARGEIEKENLRRTAQVLDAKVRQRELRSL